MTEPLVPSTDEASSGRENGSPDPAQTQADPAQTRADPTQTGAEPERPGSAAQAENRDAAALESQLRRALADLDNMRKRFDREIARQRTEERARVVTEWIPVVDNLERALEHAGASPETLLEGVQAVRNQGVDVLARLGYPRYDDVGRPFDPARDEAIGARPDSAPPGTVVAAFRPGYGTAETVLRPAAVIVSKGPA